MLRRIATTTFCRITLWVTFISLGNVGMAALPARIETLVRTKIVPAVSRDDAEVSDKLLENLIDRLDADQLADVDEILTTAGLPKLGALMLDTHMRQVVARKLDPKNVKPRDVAIAMPELKRQIDELVAEIQSADYFADELPVYETIKEYEDTFWDIHVAENKVQNAVSMSTFGERSIAAIPDQKRSKLSDDESAQLDIDFATVRAELLKLKSDLQQIKTELRIQAVTQATDIVRESTDFKERLRAAYVINFDGQQVVDYLRDVDRSTLTRPLLKDPNLLNSVLASVSYALETAGDVAVKSRLLYLGMHWWMRGRYGEGPDGAGLLKSVAALQSPMAQFPLYMPAKRPTPTDPSSGYASNSTPKFDRRHHYIWAYEYRSVMWREEQTRDGNKVGGEKRVTSLTRMNGFY